MSGIQESVIIRTVVRIIVPFIQLFALYVIMHGASGPGGGFQGGVIFGAAIILYAMIFGIGEGKKKMSDALDKILASTGLTIYAATGLICIVCGGMFLQYGAVPLIPDNPAEVSKYLIDLVEIGIGITVLAVMISLFFNVSPPESEPEEAEE
ncbi:MAG: sodium:proton antiporter [Candidatus Methanogaster sp.]|uniref:Sodium:proton antiporter n=1 Tax=Candidatus Methanogaster sp. TaxID=3386292 RepID=A0AC61L1Y0_9EURY|nr:MAG: sodium:proton antiporter [ANME-2 cluster archaeon]